MYLITIFNSNFLQKCEVQEQLDIERAKTDELLGDNFNLQVGNMLSFLFKYISLSELKMQNP